MTPAPRSIADRYDLGTMLGRGGSAAVYRGWDRALEREVAIKVLPAAVDPVALERRRRETRLLASLSHPSLVTLFDAVVEEDVTYLVMELVTGGTLRDRIARAPIDVPQLGAIGADIAGALACIHERGIVHRDLTPANVLLVDGSTTRTGAVAKLSDFGIAKLLETAPTRTTGIIGTARYLSPEQARGVGVHVASDVYSFGLCLIEAATGEPAFPGPPAETLAARLLRDPDVPRDLGYELRSLLTAMTRRDPDTRPDAAAVQSRLQHIVRRPAAASADTSPLTLPLTLPVPVPVAAQEGRTAEEGGAAEVAAVDASRVRSGGRRRPFAIAAAAAVLIGAATVLAFTLMTARTPSVAETSPPASVTSRPRTTPAATATEPARASSSAAPSPRPSAVASRASAPAPASGNATGTGKGNGAGQGNGKGQGGGQGNGKGKGGGDGRGKH